MAEGVEKSEVSLITEEVKAAGLRSSPRSTTSTG